MAQLLPAARGWAVGGASEGCRRRAYPRGLEPLATLWIVTNLRPWAEAQGYQPVPFRRDGIACRPGVCADPRRNTGSLHSASACADASVEMTAGGMVGQPWTYRALPRAIPHPARLCRSRVGHPGVMRRSWLAELDAGEGHDAEALKDLAGEAGEREEGEAVGGGPLEVGLAGHGPA